MALFGIGKKKEEKEISKDVASTDVKASAEKKEVKAKALKKAPKKKFVKPAQVHKPAKVTVAGTIGRDLARVIIKPRITEKAAVVGDNNVYTFEVARSATKFDVRDAVKELYKVTPIRVNIVNRPPRRFVNRMRNRKGVHPGMKKAYVFLKKDDQISLV